AAVAAAELLRAVAQEASSSANSACLQPRECAAILQSCARWRLPLPASELAALSRAAVAGSFASRSELLAASRSLHALSRLLPPAESREQVPDALLPTWTAAQQLDSGLRAHLTGNGRESPPAGGDGGEVASQEPVDQGTLARVVEACFLFNQALSICSSPPDRISPSPVANSGSTEDAVASPPPLAAAVSLALQRSGPGRGTAANQAKQRTTTTTVAQDIVARLRALGCGPDDPLLGVLTLPSAEEDA
ncbi:unnamed protein product, partial [Polarella glacialis]